MRIKLVFFTPFSVSVNNQLEELQGVGEETKNHLLHMGAPFSFFEGPRHSLRRRLDRLLFLH